MIKIIKGTETESVLIRLNGVQMDVSVYLVHFLGLGDLGSISQRVRTSPNLGLVLRDIKSVQLVQS